MASIDTVNERNEYARNDVLVGPDWLEEHLYDPALQLIEVDVNAIAYDAGHIDGARLWNIYRDLKGSDYRLVDKAMIEQLVTRSGITAYSTVVFHGYAPAMGFWLMTLYGHADVRILNCARETWLDDGRPWTQAPATSFTSSYQLPDEDKRIRADLPMVEKAIGNPSFTIVDVRTAAEYRGERFWPSGALEETGRAGHIPSAVNLSVESLLDEEGSFRKAADLRRIFSSIDLSSGGEIMLYCTIGGRACTAWFTLTRLLGHERVRVYDGSWAEWGRTPTTPVECA